MKDGTKRILSVVMVACLCSVSFMYVQRVLGKMEDKSSRIRYVSFFEQKEDFQVLFLGTSHVVDGVFPMELWNDYGIVSYNLGENDNTLAISYWMMKNALDYTCPNVIVIDCSRLSDLNIIANNTHSSLDAFPLSGTKVAAVRDLIQEDMQLEYLWPYWTYHFRWNQLTKLDFESDISVEKGAEFRNMVGVPNDIEKIESSNKYEKDTVGVEYLRKIIEECRRNNIDILLTYLPFPASEDKQQEANRIYDIAEEYGINYLNFLDMDIINYYTDCSDSSSHLNPSGARKVTDYLGQYLQENYNVPDQRENEAYSDWYEDYALYEEYKADNLKKQEKLDTYLMLLADKSYDVIIEINNSKIWKAELYLQLFENLGVDLSTISEATDFIVVREGGRQVDAMDNFHQNGSKAKTSLGELSFFVAEADDGEAGTYGVYLDGEECYIVEKNYDIDEDEKDRADIRILVMDKDTLETVDYVTFSFVVSDPLEPNILSTIGRGNP